MRKTKHTGIPSWSHLDARQEALSPFHTLFRVRDRRNKVQQTGGVSCLARYQACWIVQQTEGVNQLLEFSSFHSVFSRRSCFSRKKSKFSVLNPATHTSCLSQSVLNRIKQIFGEFWKLLNFRIFEIEEAETKCSSFFRHALAIDCSLRSTLSLTI